jgi:AraC family transcriptional regulator
VELRQLMSKTMPLNRRLGAATAPPSPQQQGSLMTLEIIERPAVTVVGLQIRTAPMSPDIAALWPRFMARLSEIAQPAEPGATYGVMQDLHGGTAAMDYMAAVAVTSPCAVPDGMTSLDLPAGTYARFSYPFSGLAAGFGEIFERLLPASDWVRRAGPYFERYGKDFCPDEPASPVEIWLPVAPRT